MVHNISPDPLTFQHIDFFLKNHPTIQLSDAAGNRIQNCRTFLEKKLSDSNKPYYGINTGFGALCDVRIDTEALSQLQYNLVVSHACGMGEEVPTDIVRLMVFLKIHSLSLGYSGIRLETIQRLIDMLNHGIYPVVYQLGSLGASGDLAPLAHLSLPLIGLGEVCFENKKQPSANVLRIMRWAPLKLQSKEGLALLNGTQFSQAYGCWCVWEAKRLAHVANCIAALSADAFSCQLSPFHPLMHQLRPHAGQSQAAREILQWLDGSELAHLPKTNVQDPYAFRCVPQVHGASFDAIQYAQKVFETEINSITDNPIVLPECDDILSGGNFHAQPLALALDFLAIALSELASISERRTYQLLSGQRGLPQFLTKTGGLNSGLMIPQYTAAGIVSQNKQLCTPASVDSIVSSNGQEDHVSMAANAATKTWKIVKNTECVLAIEFLTAAQAIELRRPARTSPRLEKILAAYRQEVPPLTTDRLLHDDLKKTIAFLNKIYSPPTEATSM